jgi:hypothetical protein
VRLENRAGAEEADTGDDALNGATDGIDVFEARRSDADGDDHNERSAERDERVRPHASRFPAQLAIESDAASDQRGHEQAERNIAECVHESDATPAPLFRFG